MHRFSGQDIRRIVLDQSMRVKTGHIGSCLSIADILAALYADVLNIPGPRDPERDRFILSKGHAALALYAAMHLRGLLTADQVNTFHDNGSLLGIHPDRQLPGIDFSSGSLGHGLSYGVGAALAARMQGSKRRVYVLMSDAECNEGSVWEAVMLAAQLGLSNLIAIVDLNGQQAMGNTRDILNMSPMVDKWKAFGWHAIEVDGHDQSKLAAELQRCSAETNKPHFVAAITTFGKGVSFMERELKWHYSPLSPKDYDTALLEVGR